MGHSSVTHIFAVCNASHQASRLCLHRAASLRTVHALLQGPEAQLELSASVVTLAPADTVRGPLFQMTATGSAGGSTCVFTACTRTGVEHELAPAYL